MRITHHIRRRLAGALAVSLACLAFGACGSDSEKDVPSPDSGTNAASSSKVPVPAGMVEAELPEDFPDWMPRPKAPHVLLGLQDGEGGADTVEAARAAAGMIIAAYAKDTDLAAELEHFRQSLEQKKFSIEDEMPLSEVEGSPDMQQGSLMASNGAEVVDVVLLHEKGQQPLVTVSTWVDSLAGLGE